MYFRFIFVISSLCDVAAEDEGNIVRAPACFIWNMIKHARMAMKGKVRPDKQDPANPASSGELTAPGYLRHYHQRNRWVRLVPLLRALALFS